MESARVDPVGTDDTGSLVVRGRPVDGLSPLSALAEAGDGERPWFVWQGPDERVTTLGSTAIITTSGPDRFDSIRRQARELFADRDVGSDVPAFARPRLFGGFAFHNGDGDRHGEPDWTGFPDGAFVLPSVSVIESDGRRWLTTTALGPTARSDAERALERWIDRLSDAQPVPNGPPPGIGDYALLPDRDRWTDQVRSALDRVERGGLRKVVLAGAQSVTLEGSQSMPTTLSRLGETYPDCYRFAFRPGVEDAGTFFGATPERLVEVDGREVATAALAGSTGRGETAAEDEWLAEELAASGKDNHEHDLVVEAIRRQLDGLAERVETGERTVRQLATVQHLSTPIHATLAEDTHVLSLVAALHPTPAVGGLPPDVALAAIKDAEAFDRGWYAAPVGWFDADGDGTFAVGIRSALARDGRATLFAGAGIVADSDPDEEWDEIQLKYRPILDALR